MSDTATHYVVNENGDVHSVDHDHFELYCHTEVRGRRYLKAGWREIDEAEARAANPQLFGARDRSIVRTAKELKEIKERRALEAELLGEDDEIDAEIDAEVAAAEAAAAAQAPAGRKR
jgi:hypothetical protein